MSAPTGQRLPSTAFFIWRLIRYQPWLYLVNSFFWVCYHSWPLLLGLLSKAFFDALNDHGEAGLNWPTIVALIAAVGLGKVGIIYGAAVSGVPLSFRVHGLLQRNLLARILERPGARAVPGSMGEAISILRDDVEATYDIISLVYDTTAALCFAVGCIGVLLWVNARVTLIVFVPLAIVIAFGHFVRARLEQTRARSREATARVTGAIGDIFSSVQAIQVAGARKPVVDYLRTLGDARRQAMVRDQSQNLWLDALFVNTANLGMGLTLMAVGGQMREGTFSVGDFALYAYYLQQVSTFAEFLGYLITTYRKSQVAFRRMVDLMQGAPAESLVAPHPVYLSGPLPALMPSGRHSEPLQHLEVRGLTLCHPGSGAGIRDVSFKVTRGTFTVITGRIGSGKTTLIRAMLGLLEAQSGEVRWNGRTVSDPANTLVPSQVAYIPQVPTLLSGTLRENIVLGIEVDSARLDAAIYRAVLERDVVSFPHKLETLVGTRGVRLSGGQVQRTAAARAFVHDAELFVLDDISSALDVETEELLWQRIREYDATYVVVSHRPSVLARADQIVLLADGQVAGVGTLPELLATCEEMRQLMVRGVPPHARGRVLRPDPAGQPGEGRGHCQPGTGI